MMCYAIKLGKILEEQGFQFVYHNYKKYKLLILTIKTKWYEEIKSLNKTEEYRKCKPYWDVRLSKAPWDFILLRNGYGSDARTLCVEYDGLIKKDIENWEVIEVKE